MGKIVIMLLIIVIIGGYLCLSVYKNDERFFSLPYQRRTVNIFGRKIARLFYFGFGFVMIIFASFLIFKMLNQ
ncbi:hypothetical protein [Psychrilyobacter atlanticus]|uniref:hypothetical protein n=1 Tax=Psychrilyobacter atlanticus TaxID=271091 RepID=UPI0003FF50FF|nr:hypothetical protein [Psychrilyobacter atlanticus]